MKASEMPYNMNTEVDNKSLREFPEDPEQMAKGIEFLTSKLAEDLSQIKSAALMAQIGVYSKIVGDLDKSEEMLINAQNVFETEGNTDQAINIQFRLAGTLHWKNNTAKAEKLFRDGLQKIEKSSSKKAQSYKDYGLFHLGRLKFEQGQFNDAMNLFMEALELRLIGGDIEKIEHNQKAIEICRQRLDNPE